MKTGIISRIGKVQICSRQTTNGFSIFISYSANRKQHRQTIGFAPRTDRETFKRLKETAEIVARKIDMELLQSHAEATPILMRNKSFVDFFELFSQNKQSDSAKRIAKNALERFRAFLLSQGKNDATFGELTTAFCEDFRDYLISLAETNEITHTTASHYFNAFKSSVYEAIKRKLLSGNPLFKVSGIANDTPEKEFLTVPELRRLFSTPTPDMMHAEDCRDVLLLIAHTGIAPVDAKGLKWNQIQVIDGVRCLVYQRQKIRRKVKQNVVIPLHTDVEMMLERRFNAQGKPNVDALVFPELPVQTTVNRFLKRWLRAANIAKTVTTYDFRHAFSSNLQACGARPLVASRMLGHTNLATTATYSHTDFNESKQAISLVPSILNN